MSVCFQYDFHPVGQGLFSSGCLYQTRKHQPRFVWVYDCGALPSNPPVDWAVKMQELRHFMRGKASIDLLTLSHFDDDHISGVTTLLGQFRVETLLLPYMPLWERLLIPFQKDIEPENPLMEYYIDPIAYLRERGGDNLGRIIIVEPGEEEGPAIEAEGLPRELDLDDGPWKIEGKMHFTETGGPSAKEFGKESSETESIASGLPLTVRGLWEFCPYNAKSRNEIPTSFKADVEKYRDRLLNPPEGANRDTDIGELKKIYEEKFKTSEQRNKISLFLYSGPVYSTWNAHKLLFPDFATPSYYPGRYPCWYRVHPHAPGHSPKCSLLYTGDGYLNTPKSFDSLNAALGANRMRNLGVIQVPHHGAFGNWHVGLAGKLNSVFSVFSSDPARGPTNHPHPEVLRDFWPHTPVQVNQSGASYCGWLLR